MSRPFRLPSHGFMWGEVHLLGVLLIYRVFAPGTLTGFRIDYPGTVIFRLYLLVGAFGVGVTAGALYYAYGLWTPGAIVGILFTLTAVVSVPHMPVFGVTHFGLYLLWWPAVVAFVVLIGGGENLLRGWRTPDGPPRNADPGN